MKRAAALLAWLALAGGASVALGAQRPPETSAPAAAAGDPVHAHEPGHAHADGENGHAHETSAHAAAHQASTAVRRPWSPETLAAVEALAVQDGGRIKPLSTFADFTLLRLNGKRSLTLPDGERLAPTAWLLDVLFRPELAERDALFLVQDDAVIAAIGLAHEGKKKRDRYSFAELQPAVGRLFELAHQLAPLESRERTSTQEQIVFLAENVNAYLGLSHALDFARAGIRLEGSERLAALFGARAFVPFSELVARVPAVLELSATLRSQPGAERESAFVASVLRGASELAAASDALALFPPRVSAAQDPEWMSPADLLGAALRGEGLAPEHLAALRRCEALALARDDAATFERHVEALEEELVSLARARGEYGAIGLERAYYRARLVTRALACFVLAFLAAACSWLFPRLRWPVRITWASAAAGSALVIAAIVVRCVIRGRPPVSTLYETVLFVTAVGTVLALVLELLNRQRIALSACATLGMIGLFVANGYELLDKRDTMPSLVAVLDTNFWLATHVTAITIGYSAGMLAALLATIYLLAKACGWKREQRAFYTGLGRMVYGVVCFALIFSLVGTVLGGIWANESWGRFWGWDPKENGALLIVITQVALLHARMSGLLREHGVCMAAAFGGTVIAFSWWGVNLLGVGLHSYGFTSGVHRGLWTYYGLQWAVVGTGAWSWLRARAAARTELRALPAAETKARRQAA